MPQLASFTLTVIRLHLLMTFEFRVVILLTYGEAVSLTLQPVR